MPSFVNVDAEQLTRLLQRVDDESRKMATLEARLASVEREATRPAAASTLPEYVSQRRAVSPPMHAMLNAPAHVINDFASLSDSEVYRGPAGHYSSAVDRPLMHNTSGHRVPDPLVLLRLQIDERDDLIAMLRGELECGSRELEMLKSEKESSDLAMQMKIDALDNQVRSLIEAIEATTKEDESQSPAKLYQRELKEKGECIQALSVELEMTRELGSKMVRETVAATEIELESVRSKLVSATEQAAKDKAQLEELVAIKQGQVAQLETKLSRQTENCSEFETRVRQLELALRTTEAKLTDAVRDADSARSNEESLRERLERSEAVLRRLQQDLVECAHKMAAQSTACAASESARATACARSEESDDRLRDALTLLEDERRAVKGLWNELRTANDAVHQAQKKSEDLRREVAQRQVDTEVAKAETARLRTELQQAYELVETFRKEKLQHDTKTAFEPSARSAAATPVSSSAAVAALEEQLANLTFSKEIQSREVSALRKQLESMSNDLEGAHQELIASRRADAISALKVLRDENAALRQEVARISHEWEKARDEVLRLQQRLRQATGR